MRWFIVVFLGFLVCLVSLFLLTGGIGLIRLYFYYIRSDIQDKQYTLSDFVDRGPREILSGYYAGTIGENSMFMWTLSGLKRFKHLSGTSVYTYIDSCRVIQGLSNDLLIGSPLSTSPTIIPTQTFSLSDWNSMVKVGDFVRVTRIDNQNDNEIDKLYGNSNYYLPIEKIDADICIK